VYYERHGPIDPDAPAVLFLHGLGSSAPGQGHLYRAAVARLTRTSRRAYLSSIAALAAFDARADLARVSCPTLIVAGKRDATVALEAKEEIARGIPGARLVVVPDSGHATHYDQAEIFNRMALEFIRSHA
jgi:3-oxoadipate enol-lactonase